jgi:hypothetical protein
MKTRNLREKIKRGLVLLAVVCLISGCGAAARESGFYEHSTHFKNWEHLKYSLYGYKNTDKEDALKSQQQDWWGKKVEVSK